MGPILDGLVKLQSIENRLRVIKNKLARCRRSVIFQENQLRGLQNALQAKHDEVNLTKIQMDRLELELKSRDEHIAKYRAALNLAKSNKEYSVILTELNTSKADNTKIENQILELMKNIEVDEADYAEIEAQIEEQKEKLDQFRKDCEVKVVQFEEEIAEIQTQWDEGAVDIPADALVIFKRVAETYDGEALASAEQRNEKVQAYSCGGCFMGLTAETINQLMTKDEIIRCGSCTRILVLRNL